MNIQAYSFLWLPTYLLHLFHKRGSMDPTDSRGRNERKIKCYRHDRGRDRSICATRQVSSLPTSSCIFLIWPKTRTMRIRANITQSMDWALYEITIKENPWSLGELIKGLEICLTSEAFVAWFITTTTRIIMRSFPFNDSIPFRSLRLLSYCSAEK